MALLRLVSRKSNLALVQAREVEAAIRAADPDIEVEIVTVTSAGDQAPRRRIEDFDTTGVFTKALEEALLEGAGDAAVHSAKDLPTDVDARFEIAAYLERADRRDALVFRSGRLAGGSTGSGGRSERFVGVLSDVLPTGALVATGSVRRRAQLAWMRPDVSFADLRGNMERRLAALDKCDAIVAGACGLDRLGFSSTEHPEIDIVRLDEEVVLPAAGQGAIAVETVAGTEFSDLWKQISDFKTACEVSAERAFLSGSKAGCTAPLGVAATFVDTSKLRMSARVCSPDGHRFVQGRYEVGSVEEAFEAGKDLASRASGIWRTEARQFLEA